MKNKKNLIVIAIVLVVAIGVVIGLMFANGGKDKENVPSKPVASQETGKTESKPEQEPVTGESEVKEKTEVPENTKYGNAEVYENDNGVPAAKTESGVEVELTGENIQKIFAEYEKVKDSGSDEEKELLDQLQLILETQASVQ